MRFCSRSPYRTAPRGKASSSYAEMRSECCFGGTISSTRARCRGSPPPRAFCACPDQQSIRLLFGAGTDTTRFGVRRGDDLGPLVLSRDSELLDLRRPHQTLLRAALVFVEHSRDRTKEQQPQRAQKDKEVDAVPEQPDHI